MCDTKSTLRNKQLIKAFITGLKVCGDNYILLDYKNFDNEAKKCDCFYMACAANKRGRKKQLIPNKNWSKKGFNDYRLYVIAYCKKNNKRLIILDSGYLFDQAYWEQAGFINDKINLDVVYNKCYFSLGFDDIKGKADYNLVNKQNMPDDRWKKLNIKLKPWVKFDKNKYLLIIGQTPRGQGIKNLDIYRWYIAIYNKIRKFSDIKIKFRHHHRFLKTKLRMGCIENDIKMLKKLDIEFVGAKTLYEDLIGSCGAITYSSNAGCFAAICGIPIYNASKLSMVYCLSRHINTLYDTPDLNRNVWCNKIAYTQWTPKEIESGEPWAFLKPIALETRHEIDYFV